MQRYAQIIQLKPEYEAEYIRYHAAVWPSVLHTIEACNIRNYSIFLRDSVLFAYFEYHGHDYEADMLLMAADPETQRWWRIMDPMQAPVPGAEGKWAGLREVFHFEGSPLKPYVVG
ncbi:L-rhamnose mutarotase [Granulicella rosea]|uniref:L-rhamnose mutarotase n=1 Tax=Granulicella rosea TaxID=474952 RepID=A0A239MH16_9BACT|nr:L-rhamnose mutarotase [Granulicella rosea]SNT41394.1 L-rhamnose mutarotase [Granulicella rosea]